MLLKIKSFIKNEVVFVISLICAVCTMFAVPPDKEYLSYIDFRVLCLLMCLMAVVAGLKSIGVFNFLTYKLLSKIKDGRILGISLILLPFFCSMLVTNDVALIVFVPFTIALLSEIGQNSRLIPVVVLQTVSANLGSAATPVGNPQNLFLFSEFNLDFSEFSAVVMPICGISFVLLVILSAFAIPKEFKSKSYDRVIIDSKTRLTVYMILFALCVLTVFRVIPYLISTAVVIAVFLIADKKRIKDIDFILLLTFICFFIISENLGRIDVLRAFLQELLKENALITSVGASQFISNVPSAVLLSAFTEDWKALLAGVNIGGLGTPIASLASLITLKFYLKSDNAEVFRFMGVFIVTNLLFLAVLLLFYYL